MGWKPKRNRKTKNTAAAAEGADGKVAGRRAGEREIKKALRKALFKYKLQADEALFEKACSHIRQSC